MTIDTSIKAFVAIVGLASLIFGIVQFLKVQAVEAEKPYLERKLAWCEEAVETAARIANAQPPDPNDVRRFWEMYWGVMGMIEGGPVTLAMVAFGNGLRGGDAQLPEKSLAIAHACRSELSAEWSPIWSRSRRGS